MSFGKRRVKPPQRGLLKPLQWAPSEQIRSQRQRDRLRRAALFAATALLIALLVHGDGPPLTERVGVRVERDIRVKVDQFQRIDPIRTNNDRLAAEENEPPILINDPAKIEPLAGTLKELTDAVSKAESFAKLPENTKLSWWTLARQSDDEPPSTPSPSRESLLVEAEKDFAVLKDATDTESRLNDLKTTIDEAFIPIIERGVLHAEILNPATREALIFKVRCPAPPPELISSVRSTTQTKSTAQTKKQARTQAVETIVQRNQVDYTQVQNWDQPTAKEFLNHFEKKFPSRPALGRVLFKLASPKLAGLPSTLILDDKATTEAKKQAYNAVKEHRENFRKGDLIVAAGDEITEEALAVLRLEHEVATKQTPWIRQVARACAIGFVVLATCGLFAFHLLRNYPKVIEDIQAASGLCGLTIVVLAVSRMLTWEPHDAEIIPIAIASMIIAIAHGPNLALAFVLGICVLTSIMLGFGFDRFLVLLGGSAVAALMLNEVRTRTKLIFVGVGISLTYFGLTWLMGFWQTQPFALILSDSLYRALWGLLAAFLLGGVLPFIESACGIVTGISLLELGDQRHPLLQELIRRAPGTYNHSMSVAIIAEAAAKKIGADSLLVRVGAYFHDIGKMSKPHYFVENQSGGGANRHANLAPAMSTLIIINHVKDGVEMAKQHSLPDRLVDFIEQHHGTTLVEYFYREASRRREDDPSGSPILESSFRYPGPKPQSRETAILMMADACESASRTLSDPTPSRIEGLVTDLIDKRLRDGQFDECDLTLRQISEIRESVIMSLNAIYHGRIKYPDQRTA